MRVVGGKAKGRPLIAVPGTGTRPILDRVKTALFDILRPRIEGISVLDLFSGSGGVGIEALSQGAATCMFVELNPKAIEVIKGNLERTRLTDQAQVRLSDAFRYLRSTGEQYDLIYIAPPQYEGMWIQALHLIAERPDLVSPAGLVIAQIDPREYEPMELSAFQEINQRKYGNTLLVFFEKRR